MNLRQLAGLIEAHEQHFAAGWSQGAQAFLKEPTAKNPHQRDAFYLAAGWEAGFAFARYAYDRGGLAR